MHLTSDGRLVPAEDTSSAHRNRPKCAYYSTSVLLPSPKCRTSDQEGLARRNASAEIQSCRQASLISRKSQLSVHDMFSREPSVYTCFSQLNNALTS
ncbi:unnamed protein product, partial [Mycena citricolor]